MANFAESRQPELSLRSALGVNPWHERITERLALILAAIVAFFSPEKVEVTIDSALAEKHDRVARKSHGKGDSVLFRVGLVLAAISLVFCVLWGLYNLHESGTHFGGFLDQLFQLISGLHG